MYHYQVICHIHCTSNMTENQNMKTSQSKDLVWDHLMKLVVSELDCIFRESFHITSRTSSLMLLSLQLLQPLLFFLFLPLQIFRSNNTTIGTRMIILIKIFIRNYFKYFTCLQMFSNQMLALASKICLSACTCTCQQSFEP